MPNKSYPKKTGAATKVVYIFVFLVVGALAIILLISMLSRSSGTAFYVNGTSTSGDYAGGHEGDLELAIAIAALTSTADANELAEKRAEADINKAILDAQKSKLDTLRENNTSTAAASTDQYQKNVDNMNGTATQQMIEATGTSMAINIKGTESALDAAISRSTRDAGATSTREFKDDSATATQQIKDDIATNYAGQATGTAIADQARIGRTTGMFIALLDAAAPYILFTVLVVVVAVVIHQLMALFRDQSRSRRVGSYHIEYDGGRPKIIDLKTGRFISQNDPDDEKVIALPGGVEQPQDNFEGQAYVIRYREELVSQLAGSLDADWEDTHG